MNNLDRFIEAQKKSYSIALNEIKNGKKVSHWMWQCRQFKEFE